MSSTLAAYNPELELFEGDQEAGQTVSPGAELSEMALAAQLLEVRDSAAFDRWVRHTVEIAMRRLRASPATPLRDLLAREVAEALMRVLARGAPAGNFAGVLASLNPAQLGAELEGLSPEDRELAVARQITRFAHQAASEALARNDRDHLAAVRAGVAAAARRYLPGLFRPRVAPAASSFPGMARADHHQEENMHNIDRNLLGTRTEMETFETPGFEMGEFEGGNFESGNFESGNFESGNLESGNFEYEQYEAPLYSQETWSGENEAFESYGMSGEGTFSENEEMDLASELLEVNSEEELDQFLGRFLRKSFKRMGGLVPSSLLQPLGGVLKGAIKKALPFAAGALGTMVGGPLGGMVGRGVAGAAGNALGLEAESLSNEDREFEGARQLVRLAGAAVQNASATSPASNPTEAAQAAVVQAARTHAPGLLRRQGPSMPSFRGRSGRWMRRGNRVVLFGV